MSAQLVAERLIPFSGLRPLNPRRDLNQIADLIETAFSGELEPSGLAALRDLRMLARMGPLIGLAVRSDPNLENALNGFVWIEKEQVVGNVTLQQMDPYGNRWQIANVAVARPYQRHGIASALVKAGLDYIVEQRGGWAVLQVRADNDVALRIYERLGFEPLIRDTILRLPRLEGTPPVVTAPAGLRRYRRDEWQARYDLETAARSTLSQWWRPLRSRQFWQSSESLWGERFWELLGRNRIRRWVIEGEHGLAAWLSIDGRRWEGVHRLSFAVHPSCRGDLEARLIAFALHFLADYPRWPVEVTHPGEHQEMIEALQQAGFQITRNHLAMRKRLSQPR